MCSIVFFPFWGFKFKLSKRNTCNYKGWHRANRHILMWDNLLAGKHWNEMHQYVHKMQFYYLWWIISWRWPPWLTHDQQNDQELYATNFSLDWWEQFHLELHISGPVLCVCVCGGGGVLCTHSFRSPHRKKSGAMMSGDLAGRGMSPKCEISLWRRWQTTSVLVLRLAVCAATPSYWKWR